MHLIVARNVRNMNELKFFLSNAPPETPVRELLHVAFSRWRVERCFEDQKTELGFDHFEGRSYLGLKRHQTITAVTHLFLSEVRQELRGEKPRADRLPGPRRGRRAGALVGTGPNGSQANPRSRGGRNRLHPATQRPSPPLPHQNNTTKTRRPGNPTDRTPPLRMERKLAL